MAHSALADGSAPPSSQECCRGQGRGRRRVAARRWLRCAAACGSLMFLICLLSSCCWSRRMRRSSAFVAASLPGWAASRRVRLALAGPDIRRRLAGFSASDGAVPARSPGLSAGSFSERRRFEAVVTARNEMSRELICTASFAGFFTSLNSAWTDVLGWELDELMARPYVEFIHPDDVTGTEPEVVRLTVAGLPVVNFQNRYRCRDGSYRWLEWTSRSDPAHEAAAFRGAGHHRAKGRRGGARDVPGGARGGRAGADCRVGGADERARRVAPRDVAPACARSRVPRRRDLRAHASVSARWPLRSRSGWVSP